MVKRFGPYTRIFAKRGWFESQSLWQADDHVLLVTRAAWEEMYKRFYFKDIQATVIQRTRQHWVERILLTGAALLFLSLAGFQWISRPEPLNQWIDGGLELFSLWVLLAAIVGIPAAFGFIRGPTCKFYIRTAVQIERLEAVSRLRTARKLQALLREAAEREQGVLAPEDAERLWSQTAALVAAKELEADSADATSAKRARQSQPLAPYHRRTHHWLFALLLIEGARALLMIAFPHPLLEALTWVVILAVVVVSLLAVSHQIGTDLFPFIKKWTLVSLAFAIVTLVILAIRYNVESLMADYGDSEFFTIIRSEALKPPFGHPVRAVTTALDLAGSLLLGATGLIGILRFHRTRVSAAPATKPTAPPPLPPPHEPPSQGESL